MYFCRSRNLLTSGIPVNLVRQSSETGNKRAARYQHPHPIYKGGGVFPRGPFNYGDPRTRSSLSAGLVVHPAPMHFDVADVSHSPCNLGIWDRQYILDAA